MLKFVMFVLFFDKDTEKKYIENFFLLRELVGFMFSF